MADRLDEAEARIRREFLAAVALLVAASAEGDGYFSVVAGVEAASRRLIAAWTAEMHAAGEATARELERVLGSSVSFDRASRWAVNLAREHAVRLASDLATQQRAALDAALRVGVRPRDAIGLSAPQVQALASYRSAVAAGSTEALQRALRDQNFDALLVSGEAPSAAVVESMTAAYRRRLLSFRADTIAQTQALEAIGSGGHALILQLQDQGIDLADLERKWRTRGDGKVRHSHADMDGQVRGAAEPFRSGLGNRIMYPGDPMAPISDWIKCRCHLLYAKRSES